MSYNVHCPACLNDYEADTIREVNQIARKWESFEYRIRQDERRKVRKEERSAVRAIIKLVVDRRRSLNPGDERSEWLESLNQTVSEIRKSLRR